MLENMITAPKHQQVYNQVVSILTQGSYKVGDRLPSERDLAAKLNVNVLTVRRAFRDLIVAGFITKKIGSGTYLNREITEDWNEHAVNFAIDSSCNGAIQKMFEQYSKTIAEKNNRKCRIIYINSTNEKEFVRSCIQYKQPTIFCGSFPIYKEFREDFAKSPELFVAVGALNNGQEIPSVIGADAVGIDMLMTYLQNHGHKRIAFVCSKGSTKYSTSNSILAIQKTTWMIRLGEVYEPSLYFGIDASRCGGDQITAAYEGCKKALSDLNFTAVICATDELMYGFMAAIREKGIQIPQNVSITSIGNTNLSRFANPPVTSVDLDLESHLEEAFKLLFYNLDNPEKMEFLRIIKPVLKERESVIKI